MASEPPSPSGHGPLPLAVEETTELTHNRYSPLHNLAPLRRNSPCNLIHLVWRNHKQSIHVWHHPVRWTPRPSKSDGGAVAVTVIL